MKKHGSGNITVTTEVGFCPFCGRSRNLRREDRRLGALVRSTVECESCHRTLSSTMGPIPEPEAEPAAPPEAAAPAPTEAAVKAPRPAAAKPKAPAARKTARPAAPKEPAARKPATRKATTKKKA